MQSTDVVENSESAKEIKSTNVGSCNLTSPVNAMASDTVLPNGRNSFDCDRCVDDGEVSEVESSILGSEDLEDTHRFLLPSDDLGEQDQGIDPETRSKLETLLEAAGLHGQSGIDAEILRRLTSSLCSSVSTFSRHSSEPEPAVEGVATDSFMSKPEELLAVRQLLDGGRGLQETTDEGESLLCLACSAGYLELAQVLLAMRANVEDRGVKGDCTPLMEAASGGYFEIVRLLIEHGADVNAQSSAGNTPLHYAACGGHEDIIRILLAAGANVEEHNENGHTPLMEAASAGHVGAAKTLLDAGAGINTHSNEFKESALTLACYKGHLEMVKFLLDAGADQEHKTDEMHTALMEAAMDGHVDVARLLLEHGAQVNMPADSFESPLTLAACGGHVELANLLIERGANLEEVNDEGYTPLMEAAREGHEEMVALLLAHGAEINAQTEETQETALTLACCGGFLEVVDLLVKTLANVELGCSKPLMEASQEGHIEVVKYLIRAGANVNAQTQTGDTALTYACENGHTDVASVLLEAGAELEHKSEGGRTPLMKSARAGHMQTVQFLLSKGANPNQQTVNNDHTVLSLAAAGGHTTILELLLRAGANPLHKLKDDSTVIIEAAKGGHTAVVSLLLDWHPPAGTDASSLISPPPSHLSSSAKGQSPARPLALPPAMPVPPVPPSTPTGTHKAADSAAMKTAPADSTTSSKTRLPDEAKTSVKNETAAAAASKVAVNKKPQLLEELCRFEQSIANKTAKVANILQSAERPPSTDEDKTRLLQKRRQMSSAEQAALKSTKDAAAAMAAADVAPLPTPLLPAPWQMRGANGVPWSAGQMLDETGALRLMAGAGCDDVDLLSSVMPKLDDEEQLRQQLVQLQLQQQLYHQPSGVLTSRLSPTSKVPPLDLGSQFLDMNQFSQPALLSSITTRTNPSVSVSSGTQPSARPPKAVDTVRPAPIGNAEPSPAVNSPSRTIQDVHKTALPAKSAAAATSQQQQPQPKKAIRDLSSLNMDMLDLPMQQKLQQLLHQPQSSLELFHQLFQQPQLQQAQKQLKAAVAAGTGAATATAGKKAKKTGAPATLPHPPSGQPAAASGAGSKADAACCTHSHHRHQHTATCSHDVSTCANTHCHHGAQAVPSRATQDPSSAASPPPLYLTIDVDAQTESNHDTALTLACAGGHAELVRLLLQRNAQLEHRDKKGFTPLILAATAGHLEVVQILVDHSAEVEAQSERTKDTALSLACSGGRYEVVEYLLSCGANKEHRNISDYTPLSLAASGGYVNIIKLLLNAGAEINSRTGSKLGISPLMLAAMNGHTAAVKLLLDMGSDVNAMIETNRNTALTLACFQGRYEVVSLLVDRKANIEHRAKTGLTPLMEAASGGFVEVGRVLLDKGADVNAPPVPSSRDTALTIAADKGHHLFVELLIKRGAVLDVKNKKGDSPLWLACSGGHLDVVQALVNAGADVDSQDNRRVSCLMASFRKGHVKVVKWLVRRIALFPSDQECQRFIATVTDAELKKKCQQCMEIILSAKARQAVEANKYASILLQELDAEKSREETKKAAQARKREKKKAKKREKKTDSGKPDEDDDEDDDIKPEAMENVQEANSKAEVVDEERKQDLQSRVSAPFPSNFSITEVNHYIAAIQKAAATSVDNESSSGDGGVGKSARGTRRKGRARPGTTRDSTSKDEVVAAADVARPRNGPVADVAPVSRPSQVTSSKTPTPLAEAKTAKVTEVSAEVKQTSTVTNEVNGRVGTMEEVKTASSNKADMKPSLDKNGRQMQSEKIVHQPITAAKTASNTQAKAPTAVTPRKGTRKDEDWKEVVRKSRRMTLPSNVAGRIIGRNGSHLHAIRHYTGAHLEVDKIRGSNDRLVTIKGTPEAIKHAADVVTALITRPDKEVEQLLTKMKNKLASSTNPVDLAVLDLEGKALGRSAQQLPVERISATAIVTPLIVTSSAASHTTVASSKPSQSLPVSSNSNFSIGVWEGLTVVGSADNRNAADAKTSASSCARQLFAAPTESIPGTKMSMPTYASSAAAKTKVVSSASSSTMSSNVLFDTSASGRSSVNQVVPTATSLPLVSPLRPDQPLPIKSTANVVDGGRLGSTFTGITGFTTEYSPFSGGLMPDVLVGKRDVGGGDGDGRMNFASVAAAGVVGKSHPPLQQQQIKGQGHVMGSAIGEGNSHPDLDSLEDLKAKAPGYKPIGQRSMASPLAGGDASKMVAARNSNKPPPLPANVFYSQSQISPMSLSERGEDLGDSHQHGLITQNDFYEKVAAVPSAPDASSLHSNSSTPGSSSQSPRSTSEVDRRRDEYASPYQPMTLPKVESRLNPDAPDFTLPPPRQGGAIFPPFAPYHMGSGFPHVADLTSVPPPDLGLFGHHSSLLGNNSHLPFGGNRLPTSFAPFNMLAPRLPMGRPASPVVDATPDLSVAPPGFDPLGFMPPQPPAGHFTGQGQERNQIMPQQRPIGTGRRNVGGIGPGPYGAPMERPLSWNMPSEGPADLLPPGMLQASMMMGDLGAPPGDLVFSQAVMSAYNSDPMADLVTSDDQKVPSQQFGQPRRAAMFVNGGVSSMSNDRFDLQSSNQPWSSGKDFTNNDIRLGGWN